MNCRAMAAGATGYLTATVGGGREGYYVNAVDVGGEPPGVWYGKGAAALGLTGEVSPDMMEAIYGHGLDPRDPATWSRTSWGEAERFGRKPKKCPTADDLYVEYVAREPYATPERLADLQRLAEQNAGQPRAFYDVTFSVQKSISVLAVACERAANEARAAGDLAGAEAWAERVAIIEECVMAGARAGLDYLEANGAFGRPGHTGGGADRWNEMRGLIVAQFLQHDSRDHDPQLHVHQAVWNRAIGVDGVVRALCGKSLLRALPAASVVAERVTETLLTERLGMRFETRPDGMAREVVGVDSRLCEAMSTRSRAIGTKVQAAVAAFTARLGREPNKLELFNLKQGATLATRRAKEYQGETREAFVERVERITRAQVSQGLRDQAEQWEAITSVLADEEPDAWSPRDVTLRALARVAESKPAWTRADLTRAISHELPSHLGIPAAEVVPLLEALTDAALGEAIQLTAEEDTAGLPAELIRSDGSSQYARPFGTLHATPDQLIAEKYLRASAVQRGAYAFTGADAEAVLGRYADAGRALAVDQAAAVRGVLTSGAMVEVLSAAAGAGKSYTVGALAEAWQTGGQRRVYGLATSQIAAQVLAEEGVRAMNTARWLATQRRLQAGSALGEDHQYRLTAGDLVVIDEAGMTATPDLRAVEELCHRHGAKLLLVGDPRQLGAVGAGGAMADIAEHGIRYELAEVRRFTARWERVASLKLRAGDAEAITDYDKHGRIVDGGAVEQTEAAAARAWLADTLEGRDALLIVGSNEAAARVSAHLRTELVSLGLVQEEGVYLGMDGNTAGVGDLVQARKLDWGLAGYEGNTRAVLNRDVIRVSEVREDGTLVGELRGGGKDAGTALRLPAGYVAEHATLAYACTVNAAQGRTVDTAHAVLCPGAGPNGAYVAMSRGRQANTAWMVTRSAAEDSATGETNLEEPRTGRAILAGILEHAEQAEDRTGLTEAELSAEAAASVKTHVDRLTAEIDIATAGRTGAVLDRLTADGTLADHQRIALAADEAYGSLEALLRIAELAGHDPEQALTEAVTDRPLDGVRSPARVIHHRIRTSLSGQLTPVITSFTELIPGGAPEDRRERLLALAEAADDRRRELGARTAEQTPSWALNTLGPVPDAAERLEWEHKAGWAAAYRELVDHDDDTRALGRAPGGGRVEHRATWRAAHAALDLPDVGPEEVDLSEGALRARVRAYEREETWAPLYVAEELAETRREVERERENATVWAARAEAAEDPAGRAQLEAAAEQARQRSRESQAQAEDLDTADEARAQWYAHTAATRDNAQAACTELEARAINLDDEERTTATEWLAAHRAEQTAEDPHRQVLDEAELTDVAEARRQDTAAVATKHELTDATETAVPNVREDAEAAAKTAPADRRERAADAAARAERAMAEIRTRAEEDTRVEADEAHRAQQAARHVQVEREQDATAEAAEGVLEL